MNSCLNTFKDTAKFIQTFTVQPVGYKSNIFSFEIINLLRHDLSDHIAPSGISATRNMTSRLAIKFPTPYE